MVIKKIKLLLLFLSLLIIISCLFTLAKEPVVKDELLVSAASSLTDVMVALGKEFETLNPGAKLIFNFAATGALQTQIEQGAPVDVFAGASPANLKVLKRKGFLADEPFKIMAYNTLALVVRPGFPVNGESPFILLKKPEVNRIAIGDPAYVPAGQYALELLIQLKLIESIRTKLIFATNVREALTWTETGEVDAAIVYGTDALISQKARLITQSSPEAPVEISYVIAVTRQGKTNRFGRKFVDFVTSTAGKKILTRFGFLP
ncbi:MAG: molybdate ABC transporter substrate-binding protein [Firmicutes bacterium]|nr:molybdate ABC transporter substrate-binding protein [Bacillota bacterium]